MSLKSGTIALSEILDALNEDLLRLRKRPDTEAMMFAMQKILLAQLQLLTRIEFLLEKVVLEGIEAEEIIFYIIKNGQRERITMAQEISASSQIDLSVEILNKKGRPARVDGLLNWKALKGGELGELKVSSDGMKASFIPAGDEGDLEIEVEGDADLGAGVKSLKGSVQIKLLPLEASAIKVVAVAVEMQEPAPAPQPEPVPAPEPTPEPSPEPAPAPQPEPTPEPAPVEESKPVEEENQ